MYFSQIFPMIFLLISLKSCTFAKRNNCKSHYENIESSYQQQVVVGLFVWHSTLYPPPHSLYRYLIFLFLPALFTLISCEKSDGLSDNPTPATTKAVLQNRTGDRSLSRTVGNIVKRIASSYVYYEFTSWHEYLGRADFFPLRNVNVVLGRISIDELTALVVCKRRILHVETPNNC